MGFVKRETRGAVLIMTISRPEARNALNTQVLLALEEAFAAIREDAAVRAVVLTGEGKAFVAGADIAEMKGFTKAEALSYAARGARVFGAIERLPQPVIAAVNGHALGGGCELALACDVRIASERATFGQPEASLGITPGFGGTQRLPRLVGMGRAMEMILTGRTLRAQEALAAGLVEAVYAPEALMEAAVSLAEAIAQNAPLAVRAAKRAIRDGLGEGLTRGIEAEGERFAALFETNDQRMAMEAFVQKEPPGAFHGN